MKLQFASGCDLEVIDATPEENSYLRKFKKGETIEATVINPEEETKDHFDLQLDNGEKIIGVQKSLFGDLKSYCFMGNDYDAHFLITVFARSQKDAVTKMLELENKLGMTLTQTYPKI